MKIVGVGLNKTGTTSLGECFKNWDLKHISCSQEAFNLWHKSSWNDLFDWVRTYDSFEDWPWALMYRQIDQRFPDSKFILTRRINAETWFRSLCQHAERTGPTEYRKFIYGFDMPHEHKAEHIQIYENHLISVRKYFHERPADFLEVCWEEGDGWGKLSKFLGFQCPDIPFPHANKSIFRKVSNAV